MLEAKDYEQWLDPEFNDVDAYKDLLSSGIQSKINVTPVDSPNTMKIIGEKELIDVKTA